MPVTTRRAVTHGDILDLLVCSANVWLNLSGGGVAAFTDAVRPLLATPWPPVGEVVVCLRRPSERDALAATAGRLTRHATVVRRETE